MVELLVWGRRSQWREEQTAADGYAAGIGSPRLGFDTGFGW
jgi:hypothetical protein